MYNMMDPLTVILLIIIFVIPLMYLLCPSKQQKRIASCVNKFPGPPVYPIFGTALRMLGLKLEDLFEFSEKQTQTYGPIFRTRLGKHDIIHLMKPEHAELIFNNPRLLQKGTTFDVVKPWLGNGLLVSSGETWRRHRKFITPAFHFSILDNFVEVFNEKASILVDKLAPIANGEVFDMFSVITDCTLDIICETAMGVQINAMDHKSNDYVDATYDLNRLALERLLKPWLHNNTLYNLTKDGKRFQQCLKIVHSFADKVIKEKMEKIEQKVLPDKNHDVDDDDLGRKKRIAFLDLLLDGSKHGTGLSLEQMRDEVDTFMFAGHDTTAAAICWTLFLLGNHPDIQDRVREEIRTVFGNKSDITVTSKLLTEMKYLERVVKESLRIYPSAPIIVRHVTEDIKIDDYTIPEGVDVAIHIVDMHRDPHIHKDPLKFDPDRFLPDNLKSRHPYSFVPFSAGSRNCIGQKFAMLEEKTILSKIINNYKVKSLENMDSQKLLMGIILKPLNGLQVMLEAAN